MAYNMMLQEAVESVVTTVKPDDIAAVIKKTMNTCKLTKYKSETACSQFYSTFFMCTLAEKVQPTVEQWGSIYTILLSNDSFCADLAGYMAIYRPAVYTGMFAPLWGLVQSELANMSRNQVRYLTLTKAMFTMIQTRIAGVGELIRTQTLDPEALKFSSVADQTLTQYVFDLSNLLQRELEKSIKPDDIVVTVRHPKPMEEDVVEVLAVLANATEWINEEASYLIEQELMNEGIVSNATIKAKSAGIAMKKAERNFDEFVMKKVKEMRQKRRDRKHAEIVGEALPITHEIKRLIKSGGLAIINPALGVLHWFVTLMIDRKTDAKDRAVMVRELKDTIEIIDEKIQMAERQGDDKERIELIRIRQRYVREYDRINKIRFDAETRGRLNNM